MRAIIVEFCESEDIEEALEDIKKNVQIEGPELVTHGSFFALISPGEGSCNFRDGKTRLRKGTRVTIFGSNLQHIFIA